MKLKKLKLKEHLMFQQNTCLFKFAIRLLCVLHSLKKNYLIFVFYVD